MKKFFSLLFATVTVLFASAQNAKVQAYIDAHKDLAMAEMMRTGVPAAITLAQGIIESEAGQSNLVQRSNNHFGIKCKNEWAGERTYHDDDAKGECFRVYPTAEESFRDHSDFLKTRAHYAFLFNLDPTDYEGWATGLKKAGYATNPRYPQMLIKSIIENNLQQYTLLALEMKKSVDNEGFVINKAPQTTGSKASLGDEIVALKLNKKNNENIEVLNTSVTTNEVNKTASPVIPNYPSGVFTINDVQVIYATAGTSMLALANQFNVAYKKLVEFNEMEEQDILEKDQLLFLEKKMKKGAKDFHIVQNNESLYEIAQKEGVRMEIIILFNKIPRNSQPAAGEKIYLKSPAPAPPKLSNANATAYAG